MRWDPIYANTLYNTGFKELFINIRDVVKYVNMLKFSFELIKNEVNPMDFFAITGIQVFMPEVYNGIRSNKELFTYYMDDIYFADPDKRMLEIKH